RRNLRLRERAESLRIREQQRNDLWLELGGWRLGGGGWGVGGGGWRVEAGGWKGWRFTLHPPSPDLHYPYHPAQIDHFDLPSAAAPLLHRPGGAAPAVAFPAVPEHQRNGFGVERVGAKPGKALDEHVRVFVRQLARAHAPLGRHDDVRCALEG